LKIFRRETLMLNQRTGLKTNCITKRNYFFKLQSLIITQEGTDIHIYIFFLLCHINIYDTILK